MEGKQEGRKGGIQESQASSFLEDGTPLASRVVLEVTGHLPSCVCNLPIFPDDAQVC